MKIFLVGLFLIIFAGCAHVEGDAHQGRLHETFGKVRARAAEDIRKIQDARNRYCTATTVGRKAVLKKIAIALIKTQVPAYPAEGICTQLFSQVFDMIPVSPNAEPIITEPPIIIEVPVSPPANLEPIEPEVDF